MPSSAARRHGLLVLAMLALSTAAILIRLNTGHPLTIAGWRLALATLFLTPWALKRSREFRALDRRSLLALTGAAAALALHFALWVNALRLTTVASAVILVCLQPVFTFAGEAALGVKRRPRVLLPVTLALAGAAVMTGFGFHFGSRRFVGDLLALGGSAAISVYWLLGRGLRARLSLAAYTWFVYGLAGLLLLAGAACFGANLWPRTLPNWVTLVLLALVPTLAGHSICNWALREVPASTVSTYILGEPAGSTILAALILQELPGWRTVAGAGVVLAGLCWFFAWEAPIADT